MKFHRTVYPFIGQLDIASFAGVFFLLVLFLLLHSAFLPAPGVHIRLPRAAIDRAPQITGPALAVAVDRFEQYYFEHQLISPDDLSEALMTRADDQADPITLLVYADEEVRHSATVRLATLAEEAGIRDLLIVTRPPVGPTPTGP